MAPPLARGRIVWVELLDPQGRNPKRRPAVIITKSEEIKPDGVIAVVAVTTQLDSAPSEVCVELPWHRDRHPRTKLNERNVGVCTWQARIAVADIQSIGGTVPFAQMTRILEILDALKSGALLPPSAD